MAADECANEFANNIYRTTFSLALPTDGQSLSDRQCYVRTHFVELFIASESDASARIRRGRGLQKINFNQVGFRCVYCAKLKPRDRAQRAVAYPSTISRIYQSVMDMQRFHFENCTAIPGKVLRVYKSLKTTRPRAGERPKIYWDKSARELGLVDTEGCGIGLRDGNILAQRHQKAAPRNTQIVNVNETRSTSRAKACIRRIRSKLGPKSPRYQAFLNLLREYTASNDILIARQVKECLRGHNCLEQEFAVLLPQELVESSERDDESLNDDKSEVEIEVSGVCSNEDMEIEEEYDPNIYGDYDIVEVFEDEAQGSIDGEWAPEYKDDIVNYSKKRKTADCVISCEQSSKFSVSVLHDKRKESNLNPTTPSIPEAQQTIRGSTITLDTVKARKVEAMQPPFGTYTGSHPIPVTGNHPNIEHYDPEPELEAFAQIKKGKRHWSPDEDQLLLSLLDSGKRWREIAASLSERTAKQCRERIHHLNPGFEREIGWTSETV